MKYNPQGINKYIFRYLKKSMDRRPLCSLQRLYIKYRKIFKKDIKIIFIASSTMPGIFCFSIYDTKLNKSYIKEFEFFEIRTPVQFEITFRFEDSKSIYDKISDKLFGREIIFELLYW